MHIQIQSDLLFTKMARIQQVDGSDKLRCKEREKNKRLQCSDGATCTKFEYSCSHLNSAVIMG